MPSDGAPPAADVWGGDVDNVYRYMHQRLVVAGGDLRSVSPEWCRNVYGQMERHFKALNCDVIVYGNNRGFSSDILITDTARSLGIPTIAELLNLFIDPYIVPDVVVGPSTYAVQHESVVSSIAACLTTSATPREHPVVVVIPPAVDTELFRYREKVPRDAGGRRVSYRFILIAGIMISSYICVLDFWPGCLTKKILD